MISATPSPRKTLPSRQLEPRNRNHPPAGSTIKVEPIRSRTAIRKIKRLLSDHPRNLCLFTLGINTAFRAGDLLALQAREVRGLRAGAELELKEQKTRKYRRVILNQACVTAINRLLRSRPLADEDCLFLGQRGPLTVPTINNLVKEWCQTVGLTGNYGAHSLRKTWGYHQRVTFKTPLPLLMDAYGHASQRQTMAYLCIQPQEIKRVYRNEL